MAEPQGETERSEEAGGFARLRGRDAVKEQSPSAHRATALDEQRERPTTSTLRCDLLLASVDEVSEDVIRHRPIGREADRSLTEVEAVQSLPDGFDRRRAEREDAQVLLRRAEPE
jgi:hypothetical protein